MCANSFFRTKPQIPTSMRFPARTAARSLFLAAIALATQDVGAQQASSQGRANPRPAVVAFEDVSVIPMDRERLLEHHTVVVRADKIVAVGPTASTTIPAGAVRISGRGKFLMPGLAEMHAHIPGVNAPEQLVRDILFLYVANGVTTIRGMLGAPNQLTLRTQTARGELLGPTIFVGAPSLNGNSAPTPDSADKLVRAHKAAGYDFLKLHPGLQRAVYDRIVATSREVGITWAGHISQAVGLEHTLRTHQSTIDHLDGFVEALASDDVQQRLLANQPVPLTDVIRSIDTTKIRRWATAARDAGVWSVPTAYLWESLYAKYDPEPASQRPEMQYAPPQMVNGWIQQKRNRSRADSSVTPADVQRFLAARRQLLKALADVGAGLLMGTDSPQMFNVPGFALHREIRLMQEAGVSPYKVLESGTRNVAAYVGKELKQEDQFGTITVGKRADLVLLDANPLSDVANVATRAGVMVRGRWVPKEEIDRGLADLAARNAAARTGDQ
jgi:imidazolonepropionase-like amidohydrolase